MIQTKERLHTRVGVVQQKFSEEGEEFYVRWLGGADSDLTDGERVSL